MITITATGYIPEQPEVVYTGQGNSTAKIKFKVVDRQRRKGRGTDQFVSVYETATFEVWGEEAIRLAEKLTKGRDVEVFGNNPKTEKWTTTSSGKEHSEWVFKCLHVNFPYRDQQAKQGERQGGAPQSPSPNSQPRFARSNAQQQGQGSYEGEPVARPVRNAQPASETRPASQASQQPPAPVYSRPRTAEQGEQQNRFQRASSQVPVQY